MHFSQISDPLGWSTSPFLTSAPADHSATLASAGATRFGCCRHHRRMWQFMVFTSLTNCEASTKACLSPLELSILAGFMMGRS